MGAAVTAEPKSKSKAEVSAEPASPAPSAFELEAAYGAPAGMPLFLGIGLQRKLAVGAVDDPLEREADQAAERVMSSNHCGRSGALAASPPYSRQGLRSPRPSIQRKCACGASASGQCEVCNKQQEQQAPSASSAPQGARSGSTLAPQQEPTGTGRPVPKKPVPQSGATHSDSAPLQNSLKSSHVTGKAGPPATKSAPVGGGLATKTPATTQNEPAASGGAVAETHPATQKAPPGSQGSSARPGRPTPGPSPTAITPSPTAPAPRTSEKPSGRRSQAASVISGGKCVGLPGERCSSATPSASESEAAVPPMGPPGGIPIVPMCTCQAAGPSAPVGVGSSAGATPPVSGGAAAAGAEHKCTCPAKDSHNANHTAPKQEELAAPGVVQRQATGESTGGASVSSAAIPIASQGQPLDRGTREFMEPRFGADFSQVRVHTGPGAEKSAQGLAANAYTVGRDIYFAQGKYRPESGEGRRLLAHELTHTLQQGASSNISHPQPEASRLSFPEDEQEVEARKVSDMVMSPEPQTSAPKGGPAARTPGSGIRNLITPAQARTISRQPQQHRPTEIWPASTVFATSPDVVLFEMQRPIDKHWSSKPAFVPLAGGTFIVDGIPISYGLQGSYSAQSNAFLGFGPGTLEQIRIIVTGAEAERMREPIILFDPLLGPIVLPPDPTPHGTFAADAQMRFSALAAANASASGRVEGELGVFGNALNAGAFAGLEGSASGEVWANVDTWVQFRWSDGDISLSTTLDLTAGATMAFHLVANAGVWVELRVPEIPVVTNLTHEVQDWPIVHWFVPDLTRWKWRREYKKEWPLLDKRYDWELQERFVIGNDSATGDFGNLGGFQMDDVLSDLQAQQKQGDLKDDPTGPGRERRDSDTGAVSAAKASALAQIASATRAADREKQANARLMISARKAAAAKTAAGSTGTPALATLTPSSDPVSELQKREENLNDAVASTQHLRERVNELQAPAAAPDGVSRNEARSGLEAIDRNADALSDAINNNEEGFAVPAAVEPSDADYQAMRAARIKANDAFDQCFDVVRTEKLFADDQVRAAGNDADLHPYRDAAVAYQGRALKLWNGVQKLESDIEQAREWYERRDYGLGTKVFEELEAKAVSLEDQGRTLKNDRPVGDWDTDFAELSAGHIQLKPQYRGKQTRSYFYPHDYSAGTINRMWLAIGSVHTGEDGNQYWEYLHRRSPRGDFMWLVADSREQPTLDHTSPTVLAHWNYQGGRTSDYGPRKSFYDFVGAALVVVPQTLNSSAGAREPDSYNPIVTRRFRGSKR
ncbi:MAG: DUF4157 domain-containing protein [Candidatus Korobacteraceae bacterium]